MTLHPGLVGRMVTTDVHRGEEAGTKAEVCEVVACHAAGDYGSWKVLVATHDGYLIETSPSKVVLVGEQRDGGPYR